MRNDGKHKVFLAVKQCLGRCFGATDPLVVASDFLATLRCAADWRPAEVAEVEQMVLSAVKVIVRQPRSDCCHGRADS